MRLKKAIFSIIICVIMISTLFLGSSKVVDETLVLAEEITKELFEHSVSALDEEINFGHFDSSYLKDLEEKDEYILVSCETGGYAIFEKESMELIEFSVKDDTPYKNTLKAKRLYAGPMNYYNVDDKGYINLQTKEYLDKSKASNIAKELKEIIKSYQEKRKITAEDKPKENDVLKEKVELSNSIATNLINAQLNNVPNYNEDLNLVGEYVTSSVNYIDKAQFFILNNYHGVNIGGICASVAAQLLLTFNNWANDGRIIPYDTGNPNEVFRIMPSDRDRVNLFSEAMLSTTSDYSLSDNTTSFFEKLIQYINPRPNTGATINMLKEGILSYLGEYASEIYDEIQITSIMNYIPENENLSDIARAIINTELLNNRPVIASIRIVQNGVEGGHDIVIYGQHNVELNGSYVNGYIAHFGWDDKTNVWVNTEWVRGCCTFNSTHQHSDISLNGNSHINVCETCDRIMYNNQHDFILPQQNFDNDGTGEIYHYLVCSCGYNIKEIHRYNTHLQKNGETHTSICKCGKRKEFVHWFKQGSRCFECGYDSNPYAE